MSRPANNAKTALGLSRSHIPARLLALYKNAFGFGSVIAPLVFLALLMAVGAFCWMCTRSEAIPFLPSRAGAEWIIYPGRYQLTLHQSLPVTTVFHNSFNLATLSAKATLTVCAFKGVAISINAREIETVPNPDRNWKSPSGVEVAGLLKPGTNEITAWVTNAAGPPALWLCLRSDGLSLGTSERWQASLNGTEWRSARLARQPLELQQENSLYGDMGVMDSLKRVWPLEASFLVVSLILVWVTNRWLRRQCMSGGALPTKTSSSLIYGLLVIVLIARIALFINDLPQLPRTMGFDAEDHERYIQFIQEKHALPFADDGWEMYQPPLYYLTSALVLDGFGRSVGDADAVFFIRAVNGVIGMLHCWLTLLCLRLIFPRNIQAQAAGLLVAAFLPPHLFLSQFVTNEPLAGFFVTVAIYFCLRTLRSEKEGLWMPIGMGLALGAAMLTKFSVLLALPFFPAALILRSALRKELMPRTWLRSTGLVGVGCLMLCGWHYGRVWARFGTPILGNWNTLAGLAWWQDPGFRTCDFYSSFGRVLISPAFSAFYSFTDGIYSTLWGESLGGGMADPICRPPWNYDLMGVGYWISLGISLLLIIGVALTLTRLMRQIHAAWFLVFGMFCFFSLGLIWMTLLVPSYAQVKAFYAFPVLLPFSALVACGWDWLRQRHRTAENAVWVLLLVWSMTIYTSFWVRRGNPANHFARGIFHANRKDYPEAGKSFSIALQLKPEFPEAHSQLGAVLLCQGQIDGAISQYREAIRLKPGYAEAHYSLGNTFFKIGQIDEAISQYRDTLRLKPDYAEAYNNLGTSLGMIGQIDEAICQYMEALRLKPDYAEASNNIARALEMKNAPANRRSMILP